ncbi:ABC transporter permease subunit [Candidatus Reidiella endopervernicosa]|uniref:ABC transporter permease subunit n=1 Tax=Candidatus Reidiella endopervernicosa TaxID=2738883 RepID=UPI001EF034C9|nr:ABC transporter permease subunit [Candidatus Reidiella endopervernicosa]
MSKSLPHQTDINSRDNWRLFKDRLARNFVGFGGISVIVAILLIAFYLFYEVVPLFYSAEVEEPVHYTVPGAHQSEMRTLHLAVEELNEQGVRYTEQGEARFFSVADGKAGKVVDLIPSDRRVTAFSAADEATGMVLFGLDDGTVVVVKHTFRITFPEGTRTITPKIEFPMGEAPIELAPSGAALSQVAMHLEEESAAFVATTQQGEMLFKLLEAEESMLDDELSWSGESSEMPAIADPVDYLLIDKDLRIVYAASRKGEVGFYDVSDAESPQLLQQTHVVPAGEQISALRFLTGSISLLVGSSNGAISQWFPVRDAQNNRVLTQIRSFQLGSAPVEVIAPESRRKGFAAADSTGRVGIFHTTAERRLLVAEITDQPISRLAFSPRGNALIAQSGEQLHFTVVHNEHPEISWSSLWGKVWYESYEEPKHIWQSSSASNDFEPKFSLTPISFGTLKAAFYAMIFAVPLAIFGAVYTAYFMAPGMRKLVKPGIEIMEALPTVIIGFLAGLWLAPAIEESLASIALFLVMMPLGIFLASYLWSRLPAAIRQSVPEGWQAALLMPVVIFWAWLSFVIGGWMEVALFGGSMSSWIGSELGIPFDQRNSVVVGLAMGFAVIPTIFSIAEDAIFSVPKHLTFGSLALGATPWQTMIRVVILTASPGIFSAVMIGLGRAVGETMIVLMATGNTPVMDFSIFQGMRTLSANIAVEMPESEVHSTHYRVLFLAALVLFMFTFVFNTIAELVRQRLRRKYSNL